MPRKIIKQNYLKLITEIENKIQFVTIISIFFSGVVYYFFNIYDKNNSDKIALSFGLIVFLYLIVYLLFDILKNKVGAWYLKCINIILRFGIATFLLPIIYLGLVKNQFSGFIEAAIFTVALYAMWIVPGFLVLAILYAFFKNNR